MAMTHDRFRFDSSRFPQRLDLDLPEVTLRALEQLSGKTGRSVRDLAEDLIAQAVAQRQHPQR